jgi:glycosyltransferase involved in cell wall biosynthesis
MTDRLSSLRIAAIIPCYNEALAITQTVAEFRQHLPQAQIHVFDNNSSDNTTEVARAAGAQVTQVLLRGKGNVVRRMFADVEADIYVMADGDATYDLARVGEMIERLLDATLAWVVGARQDDQQDAATYRQGHRWGNRMLTGAVVSIFGGQFSDMLSGLRVFSRRYAKSFPALSQGFEIETELTVHALELRLPWAELPTRYRSRPEGSHSKLSTYKDGWRILMTISKLYISERPRQFFLWVAVLLSLGALLLAFPLVITWLETGLVPRVPTAVLVTGMMVGAMMSTACAMILRMVTVGRRESKRLHYLSHPGPRHAAQQAAAGRNA